MNCSTLQVIISVLSLKYSVIDGSYKWTNDIDKECFLSISKQFKKIIRKEPNLLRLYGNFHVIGDIHGNLYDLMKIFTRFGYPPKANYLFLGDYVDRGKNSVEVLIFLEALKLLYPKNIYLLRGNHESDLSYSFGFYNECNLKRFNKFYKKSLNLFDFLSIGAVINDKYLCVHGGIGYYLHFLKDIESIDKPYKEKELLPNEILWSDPQKSGLGLKFNDARNTGFFFGKDILYRFLNVNNLAGLIRGHSLRDYRDSVDFERCYTVFSCSNYNGNNNIGYTININHSNITMNLIDRLEITSFMPLFPEINNTQNSLKIHKKNYLFLIKQKMINLLKVLKPK